jgi:hypothetical protein
VHIVLVHGTTQSPEGWRLLIDELVSLGHRATAVDLARFGESMTATEYGQSLADQLSGVDVDVVAAHSGSGLLLPAIAAATNAAWQCYIAAFIPDGRRSLLDEVDADPTAVFHAPWIGVDPTTDHDAARRFLFHDCKPSVADWAATTVRRFIPTRAYSEPAPVVPSISAISIVPRSDRTLRSAWMIAESKRRLGVGPIVVPGGHCPHVSRPRQIARIITSIVTAR